MSTPSDLDADVLRGITDAEGYVARICFKTGPPSRVGVELEWTVHDAADPHRPVDVDRLRSALGRHAPRTIDPNSPHAPLPGDGTVSVEPGGQVEISTAPQPSLAALDRAGTLDIEHLTAALDAAGLVLGDTGIDPYRPPTEVLDTPRYRAMRHAFDRDGPAGRVMMHSTAGVQVCLDAGLPHEAGRRWAATHELGPPLVAAFATASRHAGRDTGWASARLAAWQAIDPRRTRPAWSPSRADSDPVTEWIRYAMTAPLLCVRRDGTDWSAPTGVTFADWLRGALPAPPTVRDLDYHLSTLFPPVRPRGYLEVRYLDAQPPGAWTGPVAVLTALLADPVTLDRARDACAPVADRWIEAARFGLADPELARAAATVLELARRALADLAMPAPTRQRICDIVARRITAAERGDR